MEYSYLKEQTSYLFCPCISILKSCFFQKKKFHIIYFIYFVSKYKNMCNIVYLLIFQITLLCVLYVQHINKSKLFCNQLSVDDYAYTTSSIRVNGSIEVMNRSILQINCNKGPEHLKVWIYMHAPVLIVIFL